MEITPAGIGAGATVLSLVGGALVRWVYSALKDQKDDHDSAIAGLRGTVKVQFDKIDAQSREFQEYRVHVAETYVNRAVLKEQLEPIHDTLEEIKRDLRDERSK